jgi:hypothetical protein
MFEKKLREGLIGGIDADVAVFHLDAESGAIVGRRDDVDASTENVLGQRDGKLCERPVLKFACVLAKVLFGQDGSGEKDSTLTVGVGGQRLSRDFQESLLEEILVADMFRDEILQLGGESMLNLFAEF